MICSHPLAICLHTCIIFLLSCCSTLPRLFDASAPELILDDDTQPWLHFRFKMFTISSRCFVNISLQRTGVTSPTNCKHNSNPSEYSDPCVGSYIPWSSPQPPTNTSSARFHTGWLWSVLKCGVSFYSSRLVAAITCSLSHLFLIRQVFIPLISTLFFTVAAQRREYLQWHRVYAITVKPMTLIIRK